jgi:hypothetical protein
LEGTTQKVGNTQSPQVRATGGEMNNWFSEHPFQAGFICGILLEAIVVFAALLGAG